MIGQGVGLKWLLPLAIDRLHQCPMAEGDMHEGDLLNSVLKQIEQWPELHRDIQAIIASMNDLPPALTEPISRFQALAAQQAAPPDAFDAGDL